MVAATPSTICIASYFRWAEELDDSLLLAFSEETTIRFHKIPAGVRFTIPFIKLDETTKLLSKLETSKATGLDEVGPFFIKLSSKALAPSINLSILEGVFPENLKLAKVTPIFKNGDKHMPENYRPISILPTLSKIFEKHVAKHFYLYLSKYKVLHEAQSGFRSNHSCQTALSKLIDTWLKCIDNGNVVGTVFLDLKDI
ncbi:unnamed protein product [Mytilus edulis]|uniref:Reverse transcriptase domain-containing protein n=1 Tax=Mytilus edulis TaxID=6550 RepID=A0A8S3R0Z5_MYTED|nr:unnamed protein product [Mytilus edulis]